MNLFSSSPSRANPEQVNRIKGWVYELLPLSEAIPISISQLHCSEPGCPPLETVIAILSTPIRQYKIHKALPEIEYTDILHLFQQPQVESKTPTLP